jgi:hypothetical protein
MLVKMLFVNYEFVVGCGNHVSLRGDTEAGATTRPADLGVVVGAGESP